MADLGRLPLSAQVEEEAAAWVARHDTGPLTPDEAAQFDAWLAASPAHRAAFDRYNGLWRELDDLAVAPPRPAAANDAAPAPAPGRKRRALAAAIALGLLATGSVTAWRLSTDPSYATDIGERRVVTLDDGSRITLNTATALSVDFDAVRRRIALAQGEALFEVAHDPGRPFIVDAPSGSVRAVGTKFVVRIDNGHRLAVTVTEGKVLVARPAKRRDDAEVAEPAPQTPLTIGQSLDAQGPRLAVTSLPPSRLASRLAWRQGDVVFAGESLAAAAAEMQRYTDRHIQVDPAVAYYSIGGYFRTNDLNAFLETVESVFPVRIIQDGDKVILTKAG